MFPLVKIEGTLDELRELLGSAERSVRAVRDTVSSQLDRQLLLKASISFGKTDHCMNDGNVEGMLAANGSLSQQLTDLSPGGVFVRADSHSLIASGSLNIDIANNIGSHTNDMYPDNFGPAALSEAFMVVNDTLFFTNSSLVNAACPSVLIASSIACEDFNPLAFIDFRISLDSSLTVMEYWFAISKPK